MEKILTRRKEVFQLPAGIWILENSSDPDLDPYETIHAIMAKPGTNLEGGS